MDVLHTFLVALLGVASCSHEWISGSVTVRRGDNITLYCDCKPSTGVHIVWYRNCSVENHPSLVIKIDLSLYRLAYNQGQDTKDPLKIVPGFQFVKNSSSDSYDLLIMNITDSDEGLYYCGTEQRSIEDKEFIGSETIYRNGNVTTRISISPDPSEPPPQTQCLCVVCWMVLFSLCPAIAVLSSLLSSLLVYHLCQKKAPQPDQQTPQRRQHGDEDVCYAALEIQQTSHRPQKKKIQSSDFSTYSAINTSRM
ncbi:uncharacterized protein LOC119218613 isoform X3 [Pungitius pungitius]|uniref:uncharacterized protein LOC119218613 isoform X3 n=1 Tax=Pungitius pungitius TaxID=134920 RepID=UPI002E0F8314